MRNNDWFRWLLMIVLAVIAVYYFLFKAQGAPPPPTPPPGAVKDALLQATIQGQLDRVAKEPNKFDPRLKLCMLYDANQLNVVAEECYVQLSGLLENHPRAWYQLALLQERTDREMQAIETMKIAASNAANTEIALPHWQIGRMLLDSGRAPEALEYLKQAQEKLGNQPALMAAIMRAHIDAGQPEVAVQFAQQNELVKTPLGPYIHQLLAEAHSELGNTVEADQAMQLADSRTPAMNDSWTIELMQMRYDLPSLKMRIAAAIQQQKWEVALRFLDELARYEQPTRETRLQKAGCLLQAGSPEEADAILGDLLTQAPDDSALLIAKANAQLEIANQRQDMTRAAQALETSEKLLELDGTDLNAYFVNIRALILLNRQLEAINSCRAAWKTNPDQPTPVLMACNLIQANQLWKDNEDMLRAMAQKNPRHPTAGSMLVLSLVENGRLQEAGIFLDSLTDPNHDGTLLNRAREAHAAAVAGQDQD